MVPKGHALVFEQPSFGGAHIHLFGDRQLVGSPVGSIVVLEGEWQFFQSAFFERPYPQTLGPGLYPFVRQLDMKSDQIRAVKLVAPEPEGLAGETPAAAE